MTTQLTSAATDGANTVVNGVEGVLQTLELVPQPASRHLLQATPPPLTGVAALVNTVGTPPVFGMSATDVFPHLLTLPNLLWFACLSTATGLYSAPADSVFPCLCVQSTVIPPFQHDLHGVHHRLIFSLCSTGPAGCSGRCRGSGE